MNGWVRCKAARQQAWFCPRCGEKWTHSAGDARRWLMIWEDELEFDSASEDERAPGWKSCQALEPEEAASVPKNMADVYNARGQPIIYEYGERFCEAAFTYLKRVSLRTIFVKV
eukprot:653750-Amphidinium_carterae.1